MQHYLFYSIAEYVAGLQVYEKEASREEVVLPPLLDGSIVAMEQSINLNECLLCSNTHPINQSIIESINTLNSYKSYSYNYYCS